MAQVIVRNHSGTLMRVSVPEEFARVIIWLGEERAYQVEKWDYGPVDLEHAEAGLDDGSWMWENGVLNYTGRVRLFGVTSPPGVQALLKLIATLISMVEHLQRGGKLQSLPKPGLSSGNLE